MNEGWWVNYRTRRYIALKCKYVDHEMVLRNQQDQDWLGIPASVAKGFARFTPQKDRDALLRYAMKHCPIMRIRGHGGYTTVEFHAHDQRRVLLAIRRWARKFAAPTTVLNVSNLGTNRSVMRTVADLNRYIRDRGATRTVLRSRKRNVRVDKTGGQDDERHTDSRRHQAGR